MLKRTSAIVSCLALTLSLFGCSQSVTVTSEQSPSSDSTASTNESKASAINNKTVDEEKSTAVDNNEVPTPSQDPSPSNQGNWKAVTASLAGTPFPDEVTSGITLTMNGTEYSVLVGGKPDKGTCELDQTSTPIRMTILGTEGPNTGKTFLAISDFPSNDEMRVCYDMTGASFPTEFTSSAENGYFLVTYRRE